MAGYTVQCSIDLIDSITDNPEKYPKWQIQTAMNDARTHYEYGNVSKSWYDSVIRILSNYC